MRTLLIGGSGLLGSNLFLNGIVYRPYSSELNLLEQESIKKYIKNIGDLDNIIISAAYTNVSMANIQKNICYQTNVIGPLNIINAINKYYKQLPTITYISTDYVFSGDIGNYSINDPLEPVKDNYYALTKALGESVVKTYQKLILIRTSFCRNDLWPYEFAFDDQFTSRDTIDIIAPKIKKIIESEVIGTYHVGTERKSVYELAKKINPNIKPISRKTIKDVNIPYDTSLLCNK